ncbi:MAG: L-threonylcarbamoyladenylate synthase [Patescibacteria group bacterium]|nr:L-threonylcarbamoyladenylate synthase [Patescibacteria group bacterium]MCL5261821.1 L-threonylcarbamoyladenylate synthase [Patescibacteria group bacterium]
MEVFKTLNNKLAAAVARGAIAVVPTDTIYGIVASALRPESVEKIYRLRRRNRSKPMIILVGDLSQLSFFGVKMDSEMRKILNRFWPGKVSIVLPCRLDKFRYLHRGKQTLAFRLPALKSLRKFLMLTGPLVAPSANIEGAAPAADLKEAQKYFGNEVDFYVDRGRRDGQASALIDLSGKEIKVLRKGAEDIKTIK